MAASHSCTASADGADPRPALLCACVSENPLDQLQIYYLESVMFAFPVPALPMHALAVFVQYGTASAPTGSAFPAHRLWFVESACRTETI